MEEENGREDKVLPEKQNQNPGCNLRQQTRRQLRCLAAAHPSELEEGAGDRWPLSEKRCRWLGRERRGERPLLGFLDECSLTKGRSGIFF